MKKMPPFPEPAMLYYINLQRLMALAQFNQEMRQVELREQSLKTALLDRAPEQLRQWLEDEGVLRPLLDFGRYSGKLRFDRYGLDRRSMVEALILLKVAWRGVVVVDFNARATDCIEVTLTAATP